MNTLCVLYLCDGSMEGSVLFYQGGENAVVYDACIDETGMTVTVEEEWTSHTGYPGNIPRRRKRSADEMRLAWPLLWRSKYCIQVTLATFHARLPHFYNTFICIYINLYNLKLVYFGQRFFSSYLSSIFVYIDIYKSLLLLSVGKTTWAFCFLFFFFTFLFVR